MRNKIMGYSGAQRAEQQQKTAQQVAAGTHSSTGTPWTLDGSRLFGKLDQIKSRGPGASMGRDMDASRANSAASLLSRPPPGTISTPSQSFAPPPSYSGIDTNFLGGVPASGNAMPVSTAPRPNYSGVMPSYFGGIMGGQAGGIAKPTPLIPQQTASLFGQQKSPAAGLLSSFGTEDKDGDGFPDPFWT